MTGILIVATATLLASFLCSLFEAALYSLTPSQIELMRKDGTSGAERLARMREDIEEPIAAILTINTIAHTVGSAWCGAMAAKEYGSQAVGIFAALFTVLVLILTEIIPKSLGVRFAPTLAPFIALPIQIMIWISLPIARPAKAAMTRLTGARSLPGPSEDEVVIFSGLAAQTGGVRRQEARWVRNALRLDRVKAADLRTPRTVVETYPADMTVAQATHPESRWTHSRVPITEAGDPDKLIGLAFRREVFDAAVRGEGETTLRDLMHPIELVPESLPAHELLNLFVAKRQHLVALVDEYGGFEGVATLEDVLECMLGENIVDEHDEHEDLQQVARAKSPLEEAPE